MRPFQALFSRKGQAAPALIIVLIGILFLLTLNASKIQPSHFFIGVLAAIFFVISFVKTDVALCLLIVGMFFSPPLQVGELTDRAVLLRADDIFVAVIFMAWIAKLAVFKELGLLRRTELNLPIGLYFLACIVATSFKLIGGDGSLARSFFYLLKYFEYFLFFFLVVNNIRDMKQVRMFVFLMIATCFFVSLYGLYSYFVIGIRASGPFEGSLGEANTLAGYLVLMIGIILSLFFYSSSQAFRFKLGIVLFAAFGALVFTLSRGGWLSFFVMYLSLIMLSRKGRPFLVVGLVLMLALAPVLAPKSVKERVTTSFVGGKTYKLGAQKVTLDESGTARVQIWEEGFKKIAKKPLFGFGIPGAWVIDNQYVRVLVEVGLLGLCVFVFLLFRILKVAHHALVRCRDDDFAEALCAGFLAGFLGLLIHCFSAATFILVRIMEPFWFLMAIVVMLPDLRSQQPQPEPVEWATT